MTVENKAVLVVGGTGPLGKVIAATLVGVGARVCLVGSTGHESSVTDDLAFAGRHVADVHTSFDTRSAVERAFAEGTAAIGPIDVVVEAAVDPAALEVRPFVEHDEQRWARGYSDTVRRSLLCVQAAHTVLHERGGRLILICPTIGITGGAGLTAIAAASEARRILAKVAARRWGPAGILVNVLAPPVATLAQHPDQLAGIDSMREEPAIGRQAASPQALAETVLLLADERASCLTGLTLGVDGGALMAP